MKRLIILMLTLVFAFGPFTACAGGNDSSSRRPTQNTDDGEWTPPY